MWRRQDEKGDNDYISIKDQKNVELEARRREMEKKSEKKWHLRQLHIERREASEAEKLQRAKEATDLKARQHERMQRLAEELTRRKYIELQEYLKSRKMRSIVPVVSDEYLRKAEAELIEEKERGEEMTTSKLPSPWNFMEDVEAKQQEQKLVYRRDLQNQLIDNQCRLREKEEEKHRERKLLEEVGETIHREDLEAERRKRQTAALLQSERDAFLRARQFWKEKRKEVLKQEHDEISRIIAKMELLQKAEIEGKIDTRAARDAILEKMMNKLMEEERKRTEREELCRELYLAEKENELAKESVKLAMQKKHTARELLRDMARSQKALAEKKAKENEIDAAFAKYLADERMKHEEKETQKEQARREKVVRYGNELREMMTLNGTQRSKVAAQTPPETDTNDEKHKIKCHSESTIETLKSQETNKS